MDRVIGELQEYLPGWRNYFSLAETPSALATWTSGSATGCAPPAEAVEAWTDGLPRDCEPAAHPSRGRPSGGQHAALVAQREA